MLLCLVVGISDGDTLTARCDGIQEQVKVRLAEIDALRRSSLGVIRRSKHYLKCATALAHQSVLPPPSRPVVHRVLAYLKHFGNRSRLAPRPEPKIGVPMMPTHLPIPMSSILPSSTTISVASPYPCHPFCVRTIPIFTRQFVKLVPLSYS